MRFSEGLDLSIDSSSMVTERQTDYMNVDAERWIDYASGRLKCEPRVSG